MFNTLKNYISDIIPIMSTPKVLFNENGTMDRQSKTKVLKHTLVLMAGLPGAGKTTLADALRREFQWLIVDKDRYRKEMLKDGLDDDRASRIAYEIAFAEVRSALLEQEVSVILDTAALHRFILDTVLDIVNSIENSRLKVILCVADRDLRNERLRKRQDQSTKIRVDPATIADYLRYFEHLPSDKLVIYTSTPFNEYLDRAKRYLEGDE